MPAKADEPVDNESYDDSYGDAGDYGANYSSFTPQSLDRDTFKARNDPQDLLHRFRLQLLNAYETSKQEEDPTTGKLVTKRFIKIRTDLKGKKIAPTCSKRGVDEILAYIEKYINGHTVQCNIDNMSEFRNNMRFIGNDIICHFIAKRADWEMSLKDCDILISNAYNIVALFLSRGLFNEERKGYGESYKENTHREVRPESKPNVFQKLGGYLAGKK